MVEPRTAPAALPGIAIMVLAGACSAPRYSTAPATTVSQVSASPRGGEVSGRVGYSGPPLSTRALKRIGDAYCSMVRTEEQDPSVKTDEGGLADVLVYISDMHVANDGSSSSVDRELWFEQCQFQPHVMALASSDRLLLGNRDHTMVNFHLRATAAGNQANLASPSGAAPIIRDGLTPELDLLVKDAVHNWAYAYIHILPHRWFSVTDTNGRYRLPPLPDGVYALVFHHERCKDRVMTLVLDGNTTRLDAVFTPDDLKPDHRPGWTPTRIHATEPTGDP